MQKIRNCVFSRMLEAHLTRAELDFVLYISHCQDNTGRITGLYYRDVCSVLHFSYQTFYDAMRGLERKNIITVTRAFYGDWDICIRDNSFSDGFEGYISTGDDIFTDPAFLSLKAGEKLLAMQFLKITKNRKNGGRYRVGVTEFHKKYCEILGISKRVLCRYLGRLKKFFSIRTSQGLFIIKPLAGVGTKETAPKDRDLLKEQISRTVFRRQRVTCTEESRRDTAGLLAQYADQLKDRAAELFGSAVEKSLQIRNAGIKNPSRWNRELKPRFIHKLLCELLTKEPVC